MTLPASRARTVFRACVVSAIREGEVLMQQLCAAALAGLVQDETDGRELWQRQLAADAQRQLTQHQAQLARAYPLALLEVFADGPARPRAAAGAQDSAIDFGELALVDDADMQAQVELARAQQLAQHATEAALAELDALVSSAQGLPSVQAERNPLRPENYVRALQRVVADTGVDDTLRQRWMAHMREALARLLVGQYQRAAAMLREQGVRPVGYAPAARAPVAAAWGGTTGAHGYPPTTGWNAGPGASIWAGMSSGAPLAAHAEEALLTVNLLQQMLTGGAEPGWPGGPHAAGGPPSVPGQQAIDDLAQLEVLVGRLAGTSGAGPAAALAGSSLSSMDQAALGVVSRMMDNIARDERLPAPMQRAVQRLAPALRQLVRHDTGFFHDEDHPARRLLDELTQRSLTFADPHAPECQRFMRQVDEAIAYLADARIDNARPFARALRALNRAWDEQDRKLRQWQEARAQRERRALLAERIAASFRRLPQAQAARPEMLAWVTGPWAQAVAHAQLDDAAGEAGASRLMALAPLLLECGTPAAGDDAQALAAAVRQALPVVEQALRGSGQPDEAVAQVLQRLRDWQALALRQQQARDQVAAWPGSVAAERLPPQSGGGPAPRAPSASATEPASTVAAQPQDGVALPAAGEGQPDEPASPLPSSSATGLPPPAVADDGATTPPTASARQTRGLALEPGLWFELGGERGSVRRQLTWVSPNRSLFLFTGADGSSQSMTRRMIDRLVAEQRFRPASAQTG